MIYNKGEFTIESQNNILIGKDAILELLKGIKLATQAIRLTYGPAGKNALIQCQDYPGHLVANDAQTIIQAIHSENPLEERGLALLRELSDKANKDSGDGRKTTLIIAEEILEQGFKSELSGLQLKSELDKLILFIEQKINEQKETITEKEIYKVAIIASESERIGRLLGEIYQTIGRDGIIIPEGSGTYSTTYDIIEGVRFTDTGYLSPYMVHQSKTQAIYENPIILVTKRKISHLNDINPLLETLNKQGKKDLVIFTDDMDSGVASIMVKAHQDKIMNILIVKAPTLWKQYVFEDFAKVTGSTIVEDATGINFKNLKLEHLGTCAKITVDKDETVIIPSIDYTEHTDYLKSQTDNDSKLRLSWLQTKTCILKLGANSESELAYIRLKTEDAINSSRLALKDGVVRGGGQCLAKIATELPNTKAGDILRNALFSPLLQNLSNMGLQQANFKDDIIDSAAVIKNAVRNAVALASTVLTCGVVVVTPPPTELEMLQMQLAAKRPY